MAKVIAIANQKGGVTKTATTSAVAYGLKLLGYRILIVDADGQCNTSDAYSAKIEGYTTLYDLMEDTATHKRGKRVIDPHEALQKTEYIDIIASDYLLKQADTKFSNPGREYYIRDILITLQDEYDFIILDTPPGLGVMLSNALTAANYVIVPMEPNRDSLQGVDQLVGVIEQVKEYSNPNLMVLGMLLARVETRSILLRDFKADIEFAEEALQAKLFNSMIRNSIHVQNARSACMPIIEYGKHMKVDCIAIDDYDYFIREMLHRMGVTPPKKNKKP